MELESELSRLREALPRWSASVAKAGAKDALFIEELDVSAWWFSLFSERNPLKTDAFLRLARRDFTPPPGGLWGAKGLKLWLELYRRGARARRALSKTARPPIDGASLVFVDYFPALDRVALAKGAFRDRYFGPLQDALRKEGKRPLWLLQFVPLDGSGFSSALKDARRLAAAGEPVYFLEEFLAREDLALGLRLWRRTAKRAARLWEELPREVIFPEELGGAAAEPVVRALWERSFFGPPLVEGIAHALIARRLLPRLAERGHLVYLAERQTWEKGLDAGLNSARPRWRTTGYQHGSLLGNFWNYFHSQDEADLGLPLPDTFAANGALPEKLLAEGAAYRGLTRVEALRYLPLNATLTAPAPGKPPRVLLVAASIDPAEAAGLQALVKSAFPRPEGVTIRFKAHPMTPLDAPAPCEQADGTLAEELPRAGAVLCASSGAALEALAHGREVIAAKLPGIMPMSPLQDAPQTARWVSTPEELRAAVEAAFSGPADPESKRAFVRYYWDLDPALPRWRALLGL